MTTEYLYSPMFHLLQPFDYDNRSQHFLGLDDVVYSIAALHPITLASQAVCLPQMR